VLLVACTTGCDAADDKSHALPTPVVDSALASRPIALTLAEAERQVAGWALPEREGRIERSGALTPRQLVQALSPERTSLWLAGGRFGEMDVDVALDRLPELVRGPILVVEASQRGLDVQSHALLGDGWNVERPSVCRPVPAAHRATFTAFFDADEGHYLGHAFEAMPDALWEAARSEDALNGSPTRAESPSSTPPTTAGGIAPPTATAAHAGWAGSTRPLGEGEVPAALLPVAEVLPWVAGSRWVYRVTILGDGVRWSTVVVTETVGSAHRLAEGAMEVALAWEAETERGDPPPWWGSSPWFNHPVPRQPHAYLVGDGVVLPTGRGAIREASDLGPVVDPESGRLAADSAVEALLRLPLEVGQQSGLRLSVGSAMPVSVPAGRYAACHVIHEIVSARTGVDHWLCPGVGFARHEHMACGPGQFFGAFVMHELIDARIPPLLPMP